MEEKDLARLILDGIKQGFLMGLQQKAGTVAVLQVQVYLGKTIFERTV
jgi:hypothetical protein